MPRTSAEPAWGNVGDMERPVASQRAASNTDTTCRISPVIPIRFLPTVSSLSPAKFHCIFSDTPDVHLEDSENQAVGKSEPHRVVGLFLHHVAQESEIRVLPLSTEVGLLRFRTSEKKGCMSLLWEVRRCEDGTGAEASRVCIPFMA